jgi:hypothetical protein
METLLEEPSPADQFLQAIRNADQRQLPQDQYDNLCRSFNTVIRFYVDQQAILRDHKASIDVYERIGETIQNLIKDYRNLVFFGGVQ